MTVPSYTVYSMPAVSLGHTAACRRRDLIVRVVLPGDGAFIDSDVLVLDGGACRQVDSDCNRSVLRTVERETFDSLLHVG